MTLRVALVPALCVVTSLGAALVVTVRADAPLSGYDRSATAGAVARRVSPTGPTVGGCPVFPADNPWNTPVAGAPVLGRSDQMIAAIQARGGDFPHPDFGGGGRYGIPYAVVPEEQPLVPIAYRAYGDESDPGPFPIPLDAPVEGGSDRHVLVVREGTCELFELFAAQRTSGGWSADSGARFDLRSNALRPQGWTSADAAGLPILAGLVRYDEVTVGQVAHAIRVTFAATRKGFVAPATHLASSDPDPDLPAMGQRLRLRADFDLGVLHGQSKVIAQAMRDYGLVVADNGSNWFFQGAQDPRWDDDDLAQLKSIPGTAFEVLDTGPVQTG